MNFLMMNWNKCDYRKTEYIRRRNFLMIVIVTTNGNNTDNTEKLVYCVHRRCFSVTIHGMFCVCTLYTDIERYNYYAD